MKKEHPAMRLWATTERECGRVHLRERPVRHCFVRALLGAKLFPPGTVAIKLDDVLINYDD
jgi:hypothetical protein